MRHRTRGPGRALRDRAGAAPIFTAALSDPDHGVQAAADLSTMGHVDGTKALSDAARDPSKTPEQRAAAVMAHRSAHRVTPGLVAALADNSGVVRIAAAAVLGTLAKQKS